MLFLLKTLVVIDVLMVMALVLFRYALAPQYRSIVSGKVVALALFTPIVALFSGNIFIFCGYLVLAVAFNSRSRAELAGTYAFMLPTMPILTVEYGVGSIYLLAVSTVAAMGLGALIGFAVTRNRRVLTRTRYDVAVVLLIGMFIFISGRDATATGLLRGLTVNMLGFAGPYLLVSRGLGSREDVERFLLRFSLGAVVTSVVGCFQAMTHWVVFEGYHHALNVPFPITSFSLAMRAGLMRTGGSMLDYSAGGLFLAAALALMPMLRSRFRPSGFWMVSAALVAGLIATQSRGAWVAAIVGMLFVAAYRGRWGRVAMLAGASAAAGIMIQLFATSGRLAAIAGTTGEAGDTASYRQLLFSRGMEQIRARPLFGQPPEQLIANLPDLVQGQRIVDFVNAHLFIAMAAGVPLFLVWCYIWLMPIVDAWRLRSRRLDGADLMEAPAAIVVPVMVALVATSIVDRNLTWPTIALGLAGPCIALSRQRRAARANPPTDAREGLSPSLGGAALATGRG